MGHTLTKCTSPVPCATPRELETLKAIWAGLHNQEIAVKLKCSIKTVEAHRANLNKKLKVHNTAGLLREGLRRKWISATA